MCCRTVVYFTKARNTSNSAGNGVPILAVPTSAPAPKILYSYKIRITKSYPMDFNPLTPNDRYRGRTAPLISKSCILYTYSTNIGTEYFKHGIYSPFLSLQNAVCCIILTYLVPVLFTFYIQSVLKLKKNNSGAKRLIYIHHTRH